MSCCEGWLVFEAISKTVGNILSKKLAVSYFDLKSSDMAFFDEFPITSSMIE